MAELFELSETALILQEMADEVAKVYKGKLTAGDRIASGDLVRSVQTEVVVDGTEYAVVMDLADYWKYVEEDTRGRQTGLPGRKDPPLDAIARWVFIKPVIPRRDGKLPTPQQLTYLIAHHIGEYGTKGSHDLAETEDQVIPKYLDRLREAIGHDAVNYITKVMAQ